MEAKNKGIELDNDQTRQNENLFLCLEGEKQMLNWLQEDLRGQENDSKRKVRVARFIKDYANCSQEFRET